MSIWETGLKATEITFGLLLIYLRFCLYEPEEGRLQNYLVVVWNRIDDLSKSTWQRAVKMAQATAGISLRILDRVFGSRLLSFQSVTVAATLSISAMIALTAFDGHKERVPFALAMAATFFLAALTPSLIRKSWARGVPAAFIILCLVMACYGGRSNNDPAIVFFSGVLLGTGLDLGWLSIYRLGMRRAAQDRGFLANLLVIAMSVALVAGPFYLIRIMGPHDSGSLLYKIELLLLVLGASRIFVAVLTALQFLVLLAAVGHWVIWPPLSRVVYAMERYEFFRQRKMFATIGIGLLALGFDGIPWITHVLKVLGNAPAAGH